VSRRRNREKPPADPSPAEADKHQAPLPSHPSLTRTRTALLVVLLLTAHYAVAAHSLRQENPTIDEIAHLPAGVTYWQKGTFKLYHHNPPLAKLVAAIPVVLAGPEMDELYRLKTWNSDWPSQASFGHAFAWYNAGRYFELFTSARMVMPIFSVVGGLFVFAWSSRLYGRAGGLLSLTLWCVCPNILAHARLVTSDVAGAAMAVGSTYVFWRYLRSPTARWTALGGLALGIAQLAKFSLVLLYAYWPLLWLARIIIERDFSGWPKRLGRDLGQGMAIVAISFVTISAGYGFEGVGKPLGSYEFSCRSLTRDLTRTELGQPRPHCPNKLIDEAWQHRVNRFRGTLLDRVPVPLPSEFLIGFDDQRIETEGVPAVWFSSSAAPGEKTGYPVYLDGTLRQSGGWWYYYLATLAYKVPEGTWAIVLASVVALFAAKRSRPAWFDEFAVLGFPVIILFVMSVFTDINLGLRYVLAAFPFVFVAAGKVVPAIGSMGARWRRPATIAVVASLGLTTLQTALVHPSYLASFNWISGGPDRGSDHLIDSNLDWGQDLVTLKRWLAEHRPGQPVGLAYFGQINPSLFQVRDEAFPWFLPPVLPRTIGRTDNAPNPALIGPAPLLRPGVYAVSASLVRGLPWRLYDSGDPAWTWRGPSWSAGKGAFAYFADLTPVAKVGHSIFVYDVTEEDCARINPRLGAGVDPPR
jgi:hypothetical protein